MEPRPSTALTTALPRKRAETSRPPYADSRAERAVGVVAKAPTAKPPNAPTVAPSTNLVVPSPKTSVLSALSSFDGASLAQPLCSKVHADTAGYTEPRMMETGKRERLRSLPAVDAVMRGPLGLGLVGLYGQARATAAVREAINDLRHRIAAGEKPEVSEQAVVETASGLLAGGGLVRVVNATGVVVHTKRPRVTPTWSMIPAPAPGARATTTPCRCSGS
jgi:hypothetical protein